MNELAPAEAIRLAELEHTIRAGLATFYEVAAALEEVRRRNLYRSEYNSFADYCDRRWNMTRQRAYQLLSAAEVRANLAATTPVDMLPANEYQIRTLTPLSPEDQPRAWSAAIDAAGGHPTSREVNRAVESLRSLAEEAKDALGADGRARLEEAEQGELRRKMAEIAQKADDEKRQSDLDRMRDRTRQARRIAERHGLLVVASQLRTAEQVMERLK